MKWSPGVVVDGFELVGQAPACYSGASWHGDKRGWWSDPWWGYKPGAGWALIRNWKPRYSGPAGVVVLGWPPAADEAPGYLVPATGPVTALCCGHGCDHPR